MENFDIKAFLRSWVLPLVAEMAVLLFLFNFVINITYVPSGSMIPTIAEHSILLSTRVYQPENLERGGIYSFQNSELDKILIKRLIGLPGETVEVREDGCVYIDGTLLDEPYVKNQEFDYTGTFVVPEDSYLFFGDNRSGSNDARHWENPYTKQEDILSQARFTVWPLQNFGFLK